MSKQEKLLNALSDVRDAFIEESDLSALQGDAPNVSSAAVRRRRMLTVGIAAALVCALGLTGAGLMLHRSGEAIGGQSKWETKYVIRPAENEIGRIPTWEKKSPTQRYPEVFFRGVWYSTSGNNPQGAVVPADQLGDALGKAELTGYDIYTKQSFTVGGSLYAISGIDPACAVALHMEDQTQAYAYMNHYYQPATLGDLLDALSLEQNLTFGSVYIKEYDKNGNLYTVEFPDVSANMIWTLLTDRDARCTSAAEYEQFFALKKRFSVSVNIDLLGISNLSLSVTEDGWLDTNIMGQGHAFYIGNEAADAFQHYLLTECKGYRLVYKGADEPSVPEAAGNGSTGIVTAVTSYAAEPKRMPGING